MDWKLAIKKNREALLGIVAGLIILAGRWAVDPRVWRWGSDWSGEAIARRNPEDDELGRSMASLPHRLRLTILRILRPAESALRRLIVIVAATRASRLSKAARPEAGASLPDFSTFVRCKSLAAFRLVDPRKHISEFRPRPGADLGIPRISVPGFSEPIPTKPTSDDDGASATAILRRIAALDHALKTLPRQARRLIRLTERRTKAMTHRANPLRRGYPPGWRRRAVRDVDDVLHECYGLALDCGFKPP